MSEIERTPAQFFFEIGFGAAYAQGLIQNDMKPPFAYTDALVEHAWKIAGEAHDDHEEFDRYLALANGSTPLRDPGVDVSEAVAAEAALRMWSIHPTELDALGFKSKRHGGDYDNPRAAYYASEIMKVVRAALAALPSQAAGEGGWLPIDGIPRDGTWVLVGPGHYGGEAEKARAGSDGVPMTGDWDLAVTEATHWRPLPEAPSSLDKAE